MSNRCPQTKMVLRMSRASKLGKNFGLLTIGSFASSLLSFLLVPLYTSVLSTEEYGTTDLINTTISLTYPMLTLVISEAVMRFCLDKQCDSRQIFSIGTYVTAMGCLAMIVLSGALLITPLKDYYWYFVAYFVVQAYYATISQYVKGREKVKHYAIGGLLNSATVIACNLFFLLGIRIGVHGYLLSFIIGHLVTVIYYVVTLRCWREFLPIKAINKGLLKAMLLYSCPMILNSVSWWISNSSDKYMLSFFCGISENGIYSVAYKIPSMLSIITSLFISAWQISAAEDFNSEESVAFFGNVGRKYFGLNMIVASWLIVVSRVLAKYLFIGDYYEAWRISPILIIAFVFNTTASFYGTIYTSAKKTKMLLYSTLAGAGANIAINAVLIPALGGIGAALATMASYAMIWLIRVIDSRKIMKIKLPWGRVIPCIAILLLEAVLLNLDRWQWSLLCVVGAVAVTCLNFDTCKDIISIAIKKITGLRKG